MRWIDPFLMLSMVLSPLEPSSAKDDVPIFKPTSPWAIEYADESCRLIRNFGEGGQKITLAFERFMPGLDVRLGVAGVKRSFAHTDEAIFKYEPQGSEQKSALYVTELADGRDSILLRSAPFIAQPENKHSTDKQRNRFLGSEQELAAASHIDRIAFTGGVAGKPVVELGPMVEPLKALQSCTLDLMKHWQIDERKLLTMSRQAEPVNSPGTWVTTEDYPAEMLRERRSGVVSFRLIVDEQGMVASCHTDIQPSGPFDTATCAALTKHARFKPALDSAGEPMRTLYANTVRFQLFG